MADEILVLKYYIEIMYSDFFYSQNQVPLVKSEYKEGRGEERKDRKNTIIILWALFTYWTQCCHMCQFFLMEQQAGRYYSKGKSISRENCRQWHYKLS